MSPFIEVAVQWLALMVGALALLRWPGRTLGIAAALLAWTVVGPWATWAVLGVVVVALPWKISGRDAGVGLLRDPQRAAVVLAAAVAVLGSGVVSAAGFVVLATLAGWMVRARFPLTRRASSRLPAVVEAPPAPAAERPPAGQRFLGRGSWIVDFAPCERCGSLSVASGRLDSDPRAVVARSVCTGCGARLVGMEDPELPGQLVWFDLPPDVAEDIA